ncbi:diguanylate cyclase domain-containing protein [Bordetella sp. FB-8]|uniref:diguanylate cyclase domain-containing protein n=1 Tax=Bordetella sp. FB-8 TaxID=1159870 RepID=UPI00037E3170|nr:diguanylate cyclase [Bordetella sp. FB-8]
MYPPGCPSNEEVRLSKLIDLGILDTPADDELDRVTRLARKIFDVDTALVSLIDEKRQWFKSAAGLDTKQTPRDISFCGHAILGDTTFVVNDTSKDDRFFDNPLVTGKPFIRFYAGHPLQSIEGYNLGTLCILDSTPREFSQEEAERLVDLAKIVEKYLQTLEVSRSSQRIENLLQNTNSLLERTIHSLGVGMIWLSRDATVVQMNHVACEILGYSPFDLRNKSFYDIAHDEEQEKLRDFFSNPFIAGTAACTQEIRLHDHENSSRWIQLNLSVLQEGGMATRYFIGILTDISDRKRIEKDLEKLRLSLEQRVAARTQKLKQSIAILNQEIERRHRSEKNLEQEKAHFVATLENANDAFVEIDSRGRIQGWNRAAEKMFGWSKNEVLDQDLAEIIIPSEARTKHHAGFSRFVSTGKSEMMGKRIEMTAQKKSGESFPVEMTLGFAKTHSSLFVNAFLRDISERKKLQIKLEKEALHDALTGLPNRRYFMRLLKESSNSAYEDGRGIALLFLDLDGFKNINDTYGHEFGDKVLSTFAKTLQSCVRNSDHVCRLAGDEFTVILNNLKNPLLDAQSVAQKIIARTKAMGAIEGTELSCSTSVGIAISDSRRPRSDKELLKLADETMYKAKSAGKDRLYIA